MNTHRLTIKSFDGDSDVRCMTHNGSLMRMNHPEKIQSNFGKIKFGDLWEDDEA